METFNLSDIETVYFCSGARNHKLKPMFKDARMFFELDERSAGFKALGAAKAGKLAAVCVTSGSAVAQCLPAMLEAYYSGLPFLLISGDRPKRLHGTAAPQTVGHFAVTKGYARSQIEVTDSEFERFSCSELAFPAHINVLSAEDHDVQNTSVEAEAGDLPGFLEKYDRTLFLVSHDNFSLRELVKELRAKTDYVYAETLSGAKDLSPFANEFELMQAWRRGAFDSVVRAGHTPLSKLWRLLDESDLPVFSLDPRGYAGLSRGEVCQNDYGALKEVSVKRNEFRSEFDWSALKRFPRSQMAWMKTWQDSIPEGGVVYLGNSSVIRDFEAVQTKHFKTYGNRGANGIDGQLSTAAGLAQWSEETVYCLLGDLTFLYDYTASFELPKNLRLTVLDNGGGRIFERVGIADEILLSDKGPLKKYPLPEGVEVVEVCPRETLECFQEMSRC